MCTTAGVGHGAIGGGSKYFMGGPNATEVFGPPGPFWGGSIYYVTTPTSYNRKFSIKSRCLPRHWCVVVCGLCLSVLGQNVTLVEVKFSAKCLSLPAMSIVGYVNSAHVYLDYFHEVAKQILVRFPRRKLE